LSDLDTDLVSVSDINHLVKVPTDWADGSWPTNGKAVSHIAGDARKQPALVP